MARVKTLVITGDGTNCEVESAHAAKQAGSDETDIIFFSDLSADRVRLQEYNFIVFPGGFLDGDDLGAAQAAALRWRFSNTKQGESILDQLKNFFEAGGIILGICNGFQLLVKLGLLPAVGGQYFERQLSLGNNDSARFEDRWVWLKANPQSPCVFTQGINTIYLPVRHGEGKIIARDDAMLGEVESNNLIALQYAASGEGDVTQDYPGNPNGSPLGIAGLTDPSGRILGLMPHPEAFAHETNHPGYARGERSTLGTALFENGINYLKKQ